MLDIKRMDRKLKVIAVEKVKLATETVKTGVVLQTIKSILAGRRQGNASTKTKAFVSGGGKKPFKQKGTGRARQGSTRSPLMPGGGTAHGPQTRSFEQKINKKSMKLAISSILLNKSNEGALFLVDKFETDGKTKNLFSLLEKANLSESLIVCSSPLDLVIRAARNLPKSKAVFVGGLSPYDLLKYSNVIFDDVSIKILESKD